MTNLYLILKAEVPGAMPDVEHHTFDETEHDVEFHRLQLDALDLDDDTAEEALAAAWNQYLDCSDGDIYARAVIEIDKSILA